MNQDDPQFTAFALGELDAKARAEVERALSGDTDLQRALEELRAFAVLLENVFEEEPMPGLSAPQVARIRAELDSEEPEREDRRLIPIWTWGSVLAACIVLVFWVGIHRSDPPSSGRGLTESETEITPSRDRERRRVDQVQEVVARKDVEQSFTVTPDSDRRESLAAAEKLLEIRAPGDLVGVASDIRDPFELDNLAMASKSFRTASRADLASMKAKDLLSLLAEFLQTKDAALVTSANETRIVTNGIQIRAGDLIPVSLQGRIFGVRVLEITKKSYTLAMNDSRLTRRMAEGKGLD